MVKTISSESSIDSFDSTEIYYAKDIPQNSKAVIVIIHGFSEHLGRYEDVKNEFNNYGYSVYRFDVRGHGRSGGKKGYIKDFNHFMEDTDVIIELVNKENNNIPIFMMGYSMGGFIAAIYGIKYGNKINGQILSSAATLRPVYTRGLAGSFLKILNFFCSDFKIRREVINTFFKPDRDIESYENDSLMLTESTLKLHVEFLINGVNWLKKNIHHYTLPCLLIHGEKDRVISKKASEYFHTNISSADRQLKIYKNLTHEIFDEKNRGQVLHDINTWLLQRLH